MTVKDTVYSCLLRYPSIFENRWQVYKHLFHVYGNGFEWYNGELVEPKYAARSYDEEGRHRKIFPTFAKLGLKRRDVTERIKKEAEDFSEVFYRWNPARLKEERIRLAEVCYEGVRHLHEDILSEKFPSREEYVRREAAKKPKKESIFDSSSLSKSEQEYLNKQQCLEYSYVYNYPSDMKEDWAAARQEWEDYLRSKGCWLKEEEKSNE